MGVGDLISTQEPAGDGVAAMRRPHALREQPTRHLHNPYYFLGLYFCLQGLQREERLGRIVRAAADVAAHDYTTVDVLAAERAVGVDRVAN